MSWNKVDEKDWKLFKSRLPGWQEAYMGRLLAEYAAILTEPEKASEKFWKLDERIKRDRRKTGVIAEMSRSKMEVNLLHLLWEGAITLEDLEGFSEELQSRMQFLFRDDETEEEENTGDGSLC